MAANRIKHLMTKPGSMAVLLAGALTALSPSSAPGQYQVQEWANFEDGNLPDNVITIGGRANQRMSVVPVSEVTDQGDAFKHPEVGTHVLKLQAAPVQTDATTFQVGLAVGDVLDRSKLGPNSRALFQADFYFDGVVNPSIAVLAMAPPDNASGGHIPSISKNFYRFGVTKDTQIYYSQFRPGDQNANVYEFDRPFLNNIPKPGWHRFALVLEGPSTIRCYVDGRELPFSPLTDTSMTQIQVGLLLADNERTYTAYADNLSIQVSDDAPALPASPYDQGWRQPAGPSSKARSAGANTALPTAQVTTQLAAEWLPPVQAWNQAKQQGKGLMLYFYAPGITRVERINEILASDPAAKAYVARHAAARVDVNQLEGGSIAKKYGVFKVPTFLVISPDARSYKMVSPSPNQSWAEIEQQLAPL